MLCSAAVCCAPPSWLRLGCPRDWALYYLNGVPDRYQNAGSHWDPDWSDCNNTASAGRCIHAGEVNDADSWYEHVLSVHYPRSLLFNGNACRDGRRDFGEKALDLGGSCP